MFWVICDYMVFCVQVSMSRQQPQKCVQRLQWADSLRRDLLGQLFKLQGVNGEARNYGKGVYITYPEVEIFCLLAVKTYQLSQNQHIWGWLLGLRSQCYQTGTFQVITVNNSFLTIKKKRKQSEMIEKPISRSKYEKPSPGGEKECMYGNLDSKEDNQNRIVIMG